MSELTARVDVPSDTSAPRAARQMTATVLAGWGYHDPAWLDSVILVVSELVTNAVQHGGGCLDLSLQAHEELVTVSVADGSPVVPRPRTADATGGRGLLLIEALTTRWGVTDHHGGKRVWAELRRYPPPVDGGGVASP